MARVVGWRPTPAERGRRLMDALNPTMETAASYKWVNTAHRLLLSVIRHQDALFLAAADTAAIRVLGVPRPSREDERLPCPRATALSFPVRRRPGKIRTRLTETTPLRLCRASSQRVSGETAQPRLRAARGYSGLSITATPGGRERGRRTTE